MSDKATATQVPKWWEPCRYSHDGAHHFEMMGSISDPMCRLCGAYRTVGGRVV